MTVDFRALTERKIVRLTRPRPHDVAAQRAAKGILRAYLELIRRGRGKPPIMWLDSGELVTVTVWPHVNEAQSEVVSVRRHTPAGAPLPIVAVRNLVVVTAGDSSERAKAKVARAVARLRRD